MSSFSVSFTFRYYACLCGHEALVEFLLQNGKLIIAIQGYTLLLKRGTWGSKRDALRVICVDDKRSGYEITRREEILQTVTCVLLLLCLGPLL